MNTPHSVRGIERRSIDVVPESERHGTARNQFTLWFGANLQITAIVDGALAVVFGADALWAIIGLLVGNVLGGAVMALHSAQGPKLGLPQMISSRAQFGVYGAAVPLVLVVVMYLGFAATGSVLAGQALSEGLHLGAPKLGIVLFGALTAVVATLGYRYIHIMGRISTVVGVLGFSYLFVKVVTEYDASAFFGTKGFDIVTFVLAVSLGAGWQLTFGPYVADYSRYLPTSTPAATTFWSTFSGSVLGSQISMTLGVLVASIPASGFLSNQVGFMGDLAGGGFAALVIYLVIVCGKLAVNCLNAYGGFMTILTTTSAFSHKTHASRATRAVLIGLFLLVSVGIALFASADFLSNFKNFVLALLMVFTPWSAINLVDFYLVSKEKVDVPALYDPRGRYGRWNVTALASYAIGVCAQIPFLAQTLYTGPMTEKLGGTDVSWIVGLLVTSAVYYTWARTTANPPAETISLPVEEERALTTA